MILVTGASGFLGHHLVGALVSAGHDVRALVRGEAGARRVNEVSSAVEVATGDVGDRESLRAAAAGVDTVFHLAGSYRGSAEELAATHVEGTANLLAVLPSGARLVYVSSTSVYGWDQHWPADHSSPPRPASAYGSAKLAAERLVGGWTGGSTVIARPTIVYGPGDEAGMLPRCLRLMRRRGMRFPGTGLNRVHLTHVDDAVAALAAMGTTGDGVYVLAGAEAAPLRRILNLLAAGAGLPAPVFGIPAAPLAAVASGMEAAWSALGLAQEPPLSRHAVEVATRDRAYSARRAIDELGWQPRVSLEEGVPAVGRLLVEDGGGGRRGPVGKPAGPGAPAGGGGRGPKDPGARRESRAKVVSGNARSEPGSLGFDWRSYLDDPDEGLGTVYERFALDDVLADAVARTGATSVLHAPLFGMMGFPGLDAVNLARTGVRVGLLDFEPERLAAVTRQWQELGLEPETHLVDGPDPASWPERLPVPYDLVFSFAALWWFDDPWTVVAAQSRWADKGVLACVPNKNVFMRMRASLWHRDLFTELNEEALDRRRLTQAGEEAGLVAVGTGLFDIPPFPDTSVPLAKVVRALLPRKQAPGPASPEGDAGGGSEAGGGTWAWSILPYLKGEDPDMPGRVARLARWEKYLPAPVAPGLAHHRYTLFVNPEPAEPETAGSTAR